MTSPKETAREWFEGNKSIFPKEQQCLDAVMDYSMTAVNTLTPVESLETIIEICKLGLAPESKVFKVNGEDLDFSPEPTSRTISIYGLPQFEFHREAPKCFDKLDLSCFNDYSVWTHYDHNLGECPLVLSYSYHGIKTSKLWYNGTIVQEYKKLKTVSSVLPDELAKFIQDRYPGITMEVI